MSDTPKTDAAACDGWSGDACCVSYEFAQEQERLINALLEALKGVVRVADRATDEFDAARAAIAKAQS